MFCFDCILGQDDYAVTTTQMMTIAGISSQGKYLLYIASNYENVVAVKFRLE